MISTVTDMIAPRIMLSLADHHHPCIMPITPLAPTLTRCLSYPQVPLPAPARRISHVMEVLLAQRTANQSVRSIGRSQPPQTPLAHFLVSLPTMIPWTSSSPSEGARRARLAPQCEPLVV